MTGLVIKSTGSSYIVRLDDGADVECRIKGNLRLRGIRTTNPVAVGDKVTVSEDGSVSDGQPVYWITDIAERRNYIIRRSTNLSKESHIIAANIDQAMLLVTVTRPYTNLVFIDRFLATCEAYRVPAIIVFNKSDLMGETEMFDLIFKFTMYREIGYEVLSISAKKMAQTKPEEWTNSHATLLKLLAGKTTLLSGNSGVGKSTLLNALFGKEIARTGEISDAHHTGKHTTTFSEMFFLPNGGAVIDTPGIKGFGAIDMEKEEIGHYFREIFKESHNCRYRDCLHMGEPGCAVIEAVNEKRIAESRYESYISLLGDCEESKYR